MLCYVVFFFQQLQPYHNIFVFCCVLSAIIFATKKTCGQSNDINLYSAYYPACSDVWIKQWVFLSFLSAFRRTLGNSLGASLAEVNLYSGGKQSRVTSTRRRKNQEAGPDKLPFFSRLVALAALLQDSASWLVFMNMCPINGSISWGHTVLRCLSHIGLQVKYKLHKASYCNPSRSHTFLT